MSCSRRGFLQAAVGTGAVALGAGASGCRPDVDPAPVVELDASALSAGRLSLQVSRYPDLVREGGGITVRVPGQPELLVAHPGGSIYFVVAATCTHAGCPLGVEGDQAVCPCHGARFGADGAVLHPPAEGPLQAFKSSFSATTQTLTIDLLAGDPGFPQVEGGGLLFAFAQFPQLQQAGGFVLGKPAGYGKPLLVLNAGGGKYTALDATCTHAGCTVEYATGAAQITCPCHDSQFGLDGSIAKPSQPARKPLPSFPAVAEATGVRVTVG